MYSKSLDNGSVRSAAHPEQDLYKLANEIKDKHGGVVMIELQSVNGSNVGIKLHYYKDLEEAVNHIEQDMMEGEAEMEKGPQSIVLSHGQKEDVEQEFIVVD